MTIQEFSSSVEALIKKDNLESAANSLVDYCGKIPKAVSNVRFEYVRSEAILISGRLSRLNQEKNRGTIDPANQSLARNQGGVALLNLLKVINDPLFMPPGLEQMIRSKRNKKLLMAVSIVVVLFMVIGGIFVGRLLRGTGLIPDGQPAKICYHPDGCYIVTDHFTNLLVNPEFSSPTIGPLPENKRYAVLEVCKVRELPIAPYEYYFKVNDADKNWTGWIKQKPMGMETAPGCFEE